MKPPEVIKTAAISARQSEAVTKSSIGATTSVTKTLKYVSVPVCAYVWGAYIDATRPRNARADSNNNTCGLKMQFYVDAYVHMFIYLYMSVLVYGCLHVCAYEINSRMKELSKLKGE